MRTAPSCPSRLTVLRFLTSFRSVFILSLESSIRLASMKSLYLSRTQESASAVGGNPFPTLESEDPNQEGKAWMQPPVFEWNEDQSFSLTPKKGLHHPIFVSRLRIPRLSRSEKKKRGHQNPHCSTSPEVPKDVPRNSNTGGNWPFSSLSLDLQPPSG